MLKGWRRCKCLADVARSRSASTVVVARGRPRLRMPARFAVASRLRRLLPDKMIQEV